MRFALIFLAWGYRIPPKTHVVGQQVLWVLVYLCVGPLMHCVCATDGTLWTWGANWNGQLGDGTTAMRNSPVQVARSGCNTFSDIAVGVAGGHTAALCAGMYVPRRVLLCRSVLPPTCSALRHGPLIRTDMYCLGLRVLGLHIQASASGTRKCNFFLYCPRTDPKQTNAMRPPMHHSTWGYCTCGAHAMRTLGHFRPADKSLPHACPMKFVSILCCLWVLHPPRDTC